MSEWRKKGGEILLIESSRRGALSRLIKSIEFEKAYISIYIQDGSLSRKPMVNHVAAWEPVIKKVNNLSLSLSLYARFLDTQKVIPHSRGKSFAEIEATAKRISA